MSKGALVALVNGSEPAPGALDALFAVLGLPDDLGTAPREASARDYPTLEQFLGAIAVPRLVETVRKAKLTELARAAQSMLVLVRYIVVLYRITSMTGSSGPPIASDDPEIRVSAQHVFRTLLAGGRFLDRVMAFSNKRTETEMAALCAPVLLIALDVMGTQAADTYWSLMEQVTQNLPGLLALESLIKDVPVERRHLLSWESLARLPLSSTDELEELRRIASAWSERNPDMVALLVMRPAIGRREDESSADGSIDN